MELLNPSLPPGPAGDQFSGFSPPTNFQRGFDRRSWMVSSLPPEIFERGGDKVHVAVGKSVEKAVELIHWALHRFRNKEICIVHVHRPSPLIPTLLGKLPASQASTEVVSEYRRGERQHMRKLVFYYLSICCQSKVKASVIATEAAQVQCGIVDLVNKHGIKKLVMGAKTENCMKVRRSSSKASYVAKNASPFCEMWFVDKGKHFCVRDAFEGPSIFETFGLP
ncbi:Serine/threonine-protein kinase [Actinidia chinensis var. chinensis]|uniref:Serine/threonine-protein kinase n=1 Tax=Actinidia chinensis var. chinensis TaxID=1590841 RepID=A0A2R6PFA6_ACTCC|nr:Serine/threonine-protein kinase [Actinidia chinensis var. chinensis]